MSTTFATTEHESFTTGITDTDCEAFESIILSRPSDKTAKLVYADWLEEQGDTLGALIWRKIAVVPVWSLSRYHLGVEWMRWKNMPIVTSWNNDEIRGGNDVVEFADHVRERVLQWIEDTRPQVEKILRDRREDEARKAREAAWLEACGDGDVAAILAHPKARAAIRCNHGITNYCGRGNRKSVATAKNILANREQRKADRRVAELARSGTVNRIHTKMMAKLHALAVAYGEYVHSNVKSLYTSQRASVAYGVGGQDRVDWDAYAKSYGRPANWKDAGARLDSETKPTEIIVETARRTVVARVSIAEAKAILEGA